MIFSYSETYALTDTSPCILFSIDFCMRQVSIYFMRVSSPESIFGIFFNSNVGWNSSYFVYKTTEVISALGSKFLDYRVKVSF